MYFLSVLLLLLVFPAAAVIIEFVLIPNPEGLIWLVGKWFTFFGVGARLFLAGIRQTLNPGFTAQEIFELKDERSFPIVREIGFGNLSMGTLGLLSLVVPVWTVPAALVGGLYYGLAGVGHLLQAHRNAKEQIALVSDILIFLLLGAFVISQL